MFCSASLSNATSCVPLWICTLPLLNIAGSGEFQGPSVASPEHSGLPWAGPNCCDSDCDCDSASEYVSAASSSPTMAISDWFASALSSLGKQARALCRQVFPHWETQSKTSLLFPCFLFCCLVWSNIFPFGRSNWISRLHRKDSIFVWCREKLLPLPCFYLEVRVLQGGE